MKRINAYDLNNELVTLLIQWDKGVYLYFNDNVFDNNYAVHFFNDNMDEAMVMESSLDSKGILSVKIPDEILTYGKPIIGYICTLNDNEYRNAYRFRILVRKRPKPSNYIHTENEDYIILDSKLKEIENSVIQAKEYSENAKTSEDNAKISEENAKVSEENVQTNADRTEEYVNKAKEYMESANDSANNANDSANNAFVSEQNAKTSETNAEIYAKELKELYNTVPPATDITKEDIDNMMSGLE